MAKQTLGVWQKHNAIQMQCDTNIWNERMLLVCKNHQKLDSGFDYRK